MRTTIRLDDDLLKQAKLQAASTGMTLTALIEEALRERIQRQNEAHQIRKPVRLKTCGKGGVLPGVDLDDSAALLNLMDGSR